MGGVTERGGRASRGCGVTWRGGAPHARSHVGKGRQPRVSVSVSCARCPHPHQCPYWGHPLRTPSALSPSHSPSPYPLPVSPRHPRVSTPRYVPHVCPIPAWGHSYRTPPSVPAPTLTLTPSPTAPCTPISLCPHPRVGGTQVGQRPPVSSVSPPPFPPGIRRGRCVELKQSLFNFYTFFFRLFFFLFCFFCFFLLFFPAFY